MEENLSEIRYQMFSLKFTPLNGVNNMTSKDIVFNIVTYISNKLLNEHQGHLIDKHEARQKNSRREIFMNRAVILPKEKRIRCSMALLRTGKIPLIKPKEQFKLIPITDSVKGSIAEETHFFIDYSKNTVIICCEYNHHGPRISDIEYYFRNIAHKVLRVSKATEVSAFLDAPIEETLEKLKNVLNLDIKIAPQDLNKLTLDVQNKYFSGMRNLSTVLNPKFLRIEAYFQSPGGAIQSKALNTNANNMIRDLLNRIKGNRVDIDAFRAFMFKYEDKDGNEEVFNLLNGKKEIVLDVDVQKIKSSKDWYNLIKDELDNFIDTL
ncbi:hypothetical protein [Elizabethkingia anophelis]|uniref:hypothetical protein n=1 Tax=Elizabethkingia anophelis TaxID=1117645 RepID=UPI0009992765|nr:hypothetical protein [Elizabethkingia anophelis]MCT3728145.1 hypothetical protein [Elizabethkingia anophelis]MDV4044708.1 hypothetical protein [Elizabethkingia anophelis]OPC46054.1 hypothetical protein BAY05_10695 [Elizabethkingia anophelis]PRQ86600.1 hypothetical protein CMT87_01315 [Elizabethkingia anophelis]PRQ88087.1 hypothetical protein CMT86_06285 [Elizabethkingia anophelis]